MEWIYGKAVREERDGQYHVYVRDLPEVVTSGSTPAAALEMAADAIEVAVSGRIDDGLELRAPSPIEEGETPVALPAPLAAKASVYAAWKASGMTKVELAQRMGRHENEVRRILNPRHGSKLEHLEAAARALGGSLRVAFAPAEGAAGAKEV